jgi:AraC-like DNA-binding protein
MPILFTTNDSPGPRRLALWQDIVCDVYVGLDCTSDLGSAFRGSVTHTPLGATICSEVCSDRQRVLRTPSRIARAEQEFVLIALGRDRAGGVVQDGRETLIHPGQFALYDTTRPYELHFDTAFRQTVFKVPRDMLKRRIGATDALTAISFGDGPLQKLAFDFVHRLCASADGIAEAHASRLADQAIDLVAMALADRLAAGRLPASTHRSALLYRLKAHIRAHLADPELSLSGTAAALGISPRYVNDLLSDDGTSFQRYLLGERLAQCRRDLSARALAHRNISEIAFSWGFNNVSHFGRAFREQFGVSPREWRQNQCPR